MRDHAGRQQIPGQDSVEDAGGVCTVVRDAANSRLQPLRVDQHFQGLLLIMTCSGPVWTLVVGHLGLKALTTVSLEGDV